MEELTKLQEELKQIILAFEEKASGNKIDNKHLIKQFNALVKNEDINEELINFIIDSTDEINTRHFQFVEHTTKTIKDISEITHKDIEKLKRILETTNAINTSNTNSNSNTSTPIIPWYDFKAWTLGDVKIIMVLLIVLAISIGFITNAKDKEFYSTIKTVAGIFSTKEEKKE